MRVASVVSHLEKGEYLGKILKGKEQGILGNVVCSGDFNTKREKRRGTIKGEKTTEQRYGGQKRRCLEETPLLPGIPQCTWLGSGNRTANHGRVRVCVGVCTTFCMCGGVVVCA